MKKQSLKKLGSAVLTAVSALAFSATASASTFGDAANNVFGQLGSFANVILGVMFLGGLAIGGLAAFKFKAHSDNPGQNKITTPIVYALVAAILIGLPAFLNMAKTSTIGSGNANSLNTGTYSNVGQ